MRKVFITQESPGKNFIPAREFGDLVVLLSQQESKGNIVVIWDKFMERLRHATPDDFILLVGDPLVMSLSLCAILEKTNGVINVLRWERTRYLYEVITLDNSIWRPNEQTTR